MSDEWNHLHEQYQKRIETMEEFGGLRSWILYVLNDGPKNGVEIMDAIQEMNKTRNPSNSWPGNRGPGNSVQALRQALRGSSVWRPSPGSIYPMLSKMATTNLINKKEDGRYELTATGREAFTRIFGQYGQHGESIEQGPYSVDNVLKEMDGYASYLGDIKKEKLTPHADKIDAIIEKLVHVRESLCDESKP